MFISVYTAPPESYSRQLDDKVAATEMPYGYNSPPPMGREVPSQQNYSQKKKMPGGY